MYGSCSHPSLRIAYIDEREETVDKKPEKVYYSVLVKGGEKLDEVQEFVNMQIFKRIFLPEKTIFDSFLIASCWPVLDIIILHPTPGNISYQAPGTSSKNWGGET